MESLVKIVRARWHRHNSFAIEPLQDRRRFLLSSPMTSGEDQWQKRLFIHTKNAIPPQRDGILNLVILSRILSAGKQILINLIWMADDAKMVIVSIFTDRFLDITRRQFF